MRNILIMASALFVMKGAAQRNKKPVMAAEYASGYYVTSRNDTVWGEVRNNPESELDFYRQFFFKTKGASRGRVVNHQRAKAYGFDGRDFVQMTLEGQKMFCERLTSGRLRLLEHKVMGKENGYDAIVSELYIRDAQPETANAELGVPKKVSRKFYKKTLKPYMTEQPMIWSDLDKFEFDRGKVIQAVVEFNSFYENTAN